MKFRRVLLKLSGEVLMGMKTNGPFDEGTLERICREIAEISNLGVSLGIVIGGGNIFRGMKAAAEGMDRTSADQIGMLATTVNSLVIQQYLRIQDCTARVLSSTHMMPFAERFVADRARDYIEDGQVIILAGGTGNPYFTTDTAAALRAAEIKAEAILKGTKVDGVYDDDPISNHKAVKYREISFDDVLRHRLKVMDLTAISMCMENQIPIIVFNICQEGNLKRIISGENVGTLVT